MAQVEACYAEGGRLGVAERLQPVAARLYKGEVSSEHEQTLAASAAQLQLTGRAASGEGCKQIACALYVNNQCALAACVLPAGIALQPQWEAPASVMTGLFSPGALRMCC
jgi:hypothetical protein